MSHPKDILGKDVWSIVMDYMNPHPNQYKKGAFRFVRKRIHEFPQILAQTSWERRLNGMPKPFHVIVNFGEREMKGQYELHYGRYWAVESEARRYITDNIWYLTNEPERTVRRNHKYDEVMKELLNKAL